MNWALMFVLWRIVSMMITKGQVLQGYYYSYYMLKALFDYMSKDLKVSSTITSVKRFVFEQLIVVIMKLS